MSEVVQPEVKKPAPAPGSPPSILASMHRDGSRLMIHPADVKGRWMTLRRFAFAGLILFYVGAPFIEVGGHPMIHLDAQARRFYLFGETFNAQDFWMVLLVALTFLFGLLLVTAWRGRVWCGWACPQTVFLEGVYRPIERFFEGPRERRLKLASAPWTARKVGVRAAKLLTYLVVSLAIAHTAAAIFVSPKELWLMVQEGPALHLEAFGLTMGFTAILMFNFTWFREQFCVVLCPYGRLQSILHDKDSITVAYDAARGEPRGKLAKAPAAAPLGDCVDCKRCIQVCPTGIDIRDGLQMECLACDQCIDACDEVMTKVKRPAGLIRFASQAELAGQPRRQARPRLYLYGALMGLSFSTLSVSLVTRTPFEANVFRPRGANPFVVDGEVVRNPLQVHVFNKRPQATTFDISVEAPASAEVVVGTPRIDVASLADAHVPVSVSLPRAELGAPVELTLVVTDLDTREAKRVPVRFLAPLGVGR